MENNIHELHFDVKINSTKGVVAFLSSTFNNETEVLIKDGSNKTVSQASEAIRQAMMKHKNERYSRYYWLRMGLWWRKNL